MRASDDGPVAGSLLARIEPAMTRSRIDVGGRAVWFLNGGRGESSIVLLHGRGHAAPIWFPWLGLLGGESQIFAFDLPGFGRSESGPLERGPEGGLRFFADPIESALLALGLREALIVGHSLGGLVALEIALRGRVSLRGLVLIDGMGLGPEMTPSARAFFRLGPERLARVLGPGLFDRLNPAPDSDLGRAVAALERELLTVPGGRPAATRAFNALVPWFGPVFHRRDRLGEVRCPTTIVWGERDGVFPPDVARRAASAIAAAKVLVAPYGHSPHLEAPDEVHQLVFGAG